MPKGETTARPAAFMTQMNGPEDAVEDGDGGGDPERGGLGALERERLGGEFAEDDVEAW